MANIERVAEILRKHGINAYIQGADIKLFAASTNRWQEVEVVWTEDDSLFTDQEVASIIAHKVADLVSGPHSHD